MWKTLAIVVICASAAVYAQTGLITGRVAGEKGALAAPAAVTVVTAGPAVRLKSLTTDDTGAFAFEAPVGRASIVARADGYVSEQREVVVNAGRANPTLHFSLAPAGSLSGRVVGPTGAGIAGARVWLHYRGESHSWRLAEEAGGEQADELGNFTIASVAQGRPFVLHAEADGWLLSSSAAITIRTQHLSGVLLLLATRGATVTGRVLDAAGRPAAGVRVRLRAHPTDDATPEQRHSVAFARATNRATVSAEDGGYAFQGVPTGRIVVTAEIEGRHAALEADTTSGTNTVADLLLR